MTLSVARAGIFLAISCLVCAPLFARNSPDDSSNGASPFEVRIVPATQADLDACASAGLTGKTTAVGVEMRSDAPLPIRGYVVAVYYHDVGSRFVARQIVSKLIRPGDAMIMPGTQWHAAACGLSKSADLEDPKAELDLLMYEDGETWGPVKLAESNRLDGVSIGMNFVAGRDDQERGYVTAKVLQGEETGEPIPTVGKSSPLQFYGLRDSDDQGNLLLDVEATNVGDEPIVGYEFAITFYDPKSHDVVKNVTTKALAIGGDPVDDLQRGSTWVSGGRKIPISENGEPDTYTVTLDAVVLANGSVLGPQESREAPELIGMVQGMAAMKPANGAQ